MGSVGVVGGGVAGLAAACRLAQLGLDIVLYEAGDRVGGVVGTERREGYLAEFGPNSFAEPEPAVARLLTELGLDARRVDANAAARVRYVVRRGRLIPLPLSLPAFLTSRLFSVRGKLAIAREPFVRPGDPNVEESVAAFVRRRLGREALDYAANPFIGGIYAGDPEALSVRAALPKLYALEREHGSIIRGAMALARVRRERVAPGPAGVIRSFRAGLAEMPEALVRRLEGRIRLRAPVRAVGRVHAGWTIVTDQGETRHEAVVYGGPAHALAELRVECAGRERLADLKAIPYPPVSVLVLGFRRADVAHPLDGFGVLVPAVEGRRILGVLFSSTLFPGRAPEGHVTLSAFVGGARQPDLARLDTEAITRLVLVELEALLGVSGVPTFRRHVFWPRAIPQYVLGYGRLARLMDEVEAANPGLAFAGAYRQGVSLGDTIASGLAAAERAAAAVGRDAGSAGGPASVRGT
jgi:oxygen-dependent protoporphyrinogen oxidase